MTAEYTFFWSSHGIFTKIDHILGPKTLLKKCKRIEITQSVLSDHERIELKVNKSKISGQSPKL